MAPFPPFSPFPPGSVRAVPATRGAVCLYRVPYYADFVAQEETGRESFFVTWRRRAFFGDALEVEQWIPGVVV